MVALSISTLPLRTRLITSMTPTSPSPVSPTAHAYTTTTQRSSFIERLPSCIIQEIGRHADMKSLLHLTLCSRRLSRLFTPALYHTVSFKTNKQCKAGLLSLSRKPHVSQHIRVLAIHVNALEWTEHGDEVDEDLLAGLVAKMAERRGLKSLEAFEWDGMEMPVDELWEALKTSCRHLKRIATSVGEDALNPASPLWDFHDLRAFALNVKCHSLDWLSNGLPRTEKLPRRCWEMLLERSPRLEELKITGPAPSPRLFDIRHITSGRWSRLKTLVLGDMVMISTSKGEEQTRKDHAAFQSFFIAHHKLERVILQHAGGSAHFPQSFVLPASALPNLRSFGGPLKYVRTLPFPQRLRELTLTSLYHMASAFPPTYAVLQELRWLESLSIWIDLSFGRGSLGLGGETSAAVGIGIGMMGIGSGAAANATGRGDGYDDVHMLRSLVLCRPGLKHLEVSCFTRPTFAIRDFSTVIQAAGPSLSSFALTKVYKSNEEDMTRIAGRLVRENPGLRKFTVRSTHDSWLSPGGGRVKCLGVYEVLDAPPNLAAYANGEEDNSSTLLVSEWGQKNITGKEYARHFVHIVQPPRPKSGSFSSSSSSSHSPNSSVSISSPSGGGTSSPFPPSSWQTVGGALGKIKGHRRRLSSASAPAEAEAENVPTEGDVDVCGDVRRSAPVSRSASLKWAPSGWKSGGGSGGGGGTTSSGTSTPSSGRSNSMNLGTFRRLSLKLTGGRGAGGGKEKKERRASCCSNLDVPLTMQGQGPTGAVGMERIVSGQVVGHDADVDVETTTTMTGNGPQQQQVTFAPLENYQSQRQRQYTSNGFGKQNECEGPDDDSEAQALQGNGLGRSGTGSSTNTNTTHHGSGSTSTSSHGGGGTTMSSSLEMTSVSSHSTSTSTSTSHRLHHRRQQQDRHKQQQQQLQLQLHQEEEEEENTRSCSSRRLGVSSKLNGSCGIDKLAFWKKLHGVESGAARVGRGVGDETEIVDGFVMV